MTNKKELKKAMIDAGLKTNDLVEITGISRTSLYMKMNDKKNFIAREILAISNALSLNAEQVNTIFFNGEIAKNGNLSDC